MMDTDGRAGPRLSIPRRFNGPPDSGNGGYVCGRLAQYLSGPATVRLHRPPPLDRDLRVEADGDEARLVDGAGTVAVARRTPIDLVPPAVPTFDEARAASKDYAGFIRHHLPMCFVCGPQRAEGDGLRIFPGPTHTPSVLAAPWVPDASLTAGSTRVLPEFLWAALDCAGAFSVMGPDDPLVLLGELAARVDADVEAGEPCVVVAWPLGSQGRKHVAGTAVFGASGRPVAVARATWIQVAAARDAAPPAGDAA